MSKIYKATIYFNDINGVYDNFAQLKDDLDNSMDCIGMYAKDIMEIEMTDYYEQVGDNYPWNTIDDDVALTELENFLKGVDIDNG